MREASWFGNCYRQGFKNLGQKTLEDFDARALARFWKDCGAELVYMNAIHGDEVLYPSRLTPMAVHLKGRDLVGEFTDECRRLGIRAGAYISPPYHRPFLEAHPEWRQTKTDGTFHLAPWSKRAGREDYAGCWNSEYRDRFCELVSELFSRYPLDAVFYDNLLSMHGVCHCPSCAVKFKADTGFELPGVHDMADPAFRAYYDWKNRTMTDFCRDLVAAARVVNPDVQPVVNTPVAWCNWCAVQPEAFLDAAEWLCTEVQAEASRHAGRIHASGVGVSAYKLAYTRGQQRGRRKVQAYNYMGRLSVNIDVDVMLELKSSIAQGGLPCVQGEQPSLKAAFDYIRTCEPYLKDTTPVTWAALLASQVSCDTHRLQESVFGAYFEDIEGLFSAMLDLRLPTEFLSGRDLAEGGLAPYSVLLLSDAGYVTEAQAAEIRRFVSDGGGLVATGQTSLVGEDGRPLEDFALSDVLGVSAAPDVDWSAPAPKGNGPHAYLDFGGGEAWWGDAVQPSRYVEAGDRLIGKKRWMVDARAAAIFSPFQTSVAAEGAVTVATVGSADPAVTQRFAGIVEHRYGKGRVVYLAPRLGEIYARYAYEMWRRVLKEAVRRVAPRPAPVEVEAPLCVTAYAWDQPEPGRWIVHLVNELDEAGRPRGRMGVGKNGEPGSVPRTRPIPVDGVDIIVRKPGATRAELPLENRTLPVEREGDALRIRVGRVEQHSLIVVKGEWTCE